MTTSAVGISTGTDAYLHSNSRSIGGTAREEQYSLPAWGADPTYQIVMDDVSPDTANDHIMQIMADGTNYSRLVRLEVRPTENLPAADSVLKLALYRLTTAGTGGTAEADGPYDDADAYAGDMRNSPSSKGTEGDLLEVFYMHIDSTLSGNKPDTILWEALPGVKPIIFGNGTADGIALKVIDAVASTALLIKATIVETTYK